MRDFAGCGIPAQPCCGGEDLAVLLPSAFPVSQSSPALTEPSRFGCRLQLFVIIPNAGFFNRNSRFSAVVSEE